MPSWGDLSFNDFLTGLWFAVFGVIGWIGSRVGVRRPAPAAPAAVEVAGALIDNKRIDTLIEAIGQNSYHMTDLKKSVEALRQASDADRELSERYRQALIQNTQTAIEVAKMAERLVGTMHDLREETKDLRDEMLRGGRPR